MLVMVSLDHFPSVNYLVPSSQLAQLARLIEGTEGCLSSKPPNRLRIAQTHHCGTVDRCPNAIHLVCRVVRTSSSTLQSLILSLCHREV